MRRSVVPVPAAGAGPTASRWHSSRRHAGRRRRGRRRLGRRRRRWRTYRGRCGWNVGRRGERLRCRCRGWLRHRWRSRRWARRHGRGRCRHRALDYRHRRRRGLAHCSRLRSRLARGFLSGRSLGAPLRRCLLPRGRLRRPSGGWTRLAPGDRRLALRALGARFPVLFPSGHCDSLGIQHLSRVFARVLSSTTRRAGCKCRADQPAARNVR